MHSQAAHNTEDFLSKT